MPVKTGIGKKAGAKKVDAESYIPPIGDWEETNIIYDFGDGWLICEDRTEYDRRLMAKLTLTCVSTLIPQCTGDETPEEAKAKLRKTQYAYMTDQQFESEWRYIKGQYKEKVYKLLHVRDPEGRPMSCILMIKKSVKDDPNKMRGHHYGASNDLGQSAGIELDGELYCICEVRLGTGKTGPLHVEDRVIQWFQAATGTWNEEAYLHTQIGRRKYDAWTSEQNLDLNQYRRAEVAA